MLDFKELPKDGIRFEQLVRELLMKKGLAPLWTGKGADSGRDLLARETLTGTVQNAERLWLVDCKHKAHSNAAVGVRDVTDVRDRCARVGAQGLLLVCSTSMSAELFRKLQELKVQAQLAIEVWDAVTIERLLLTPVSYFIAQQFFPRSLAIPAWKLYYTESGHQWMAHFRGCFLYILSRDGIDPPPLGDLESIVSQLEEVPLAEQESLRIRLIWHDTRNGPFYNAAFDYLVPSDRPPALNPTDLIHHLGDGNVDGGIVSWYVRLQVRLPMSDSDSPDDPAYYTELDPVGHEGFYGRLPLTYYEEHGGWVRVCPPIIRSFKDQLMWKKDQEKFGFREIGNLKVAQGITGKESGAPPSGTSKVGRGQSGSRPSAQSARSRRRRKTSRRR